ncbi:probable malonyl-CoA-acyl carrier protein transacylase, mitochondrial [Prorops nasuta]|uniref:probable malonyl-CoA-acyl carrier protein transacylase, mitochondrial n=1 Tax=Prorops nasuta TaxID=863751 RepID=UPI0034CF6DCF
MLQRTIYSKIGFRMPSSLWLTQNLKFSSIIDDEKKNITDQLKENPLDSNSREEVNIQNERREDISELLSNAATYDDLKDKTWATTPYPAGGPTSPELEMIEKKVIKPAVTDNTIFLFPGQGTLKVGLAKKYMKFPRAKELYDMASEILEYDLLDLCLNGPQEKLDQTLYNQPATVVTSLAALERVREERPKTFDTCRGAAGYSLGEITALIFAGTISFEQGIRLVAVRAAAMQVASNQAAQGMLSLYCRPDAQLSFALKQAKEWAMNNGIERPVCQVAIYLYTQSKVIGGHDEALKYIEANSEKFGLIKLQRLPVSGAFHTPLMEPAMIPFHKILDATNIKDPKIFIYSNINAKPYYGSKLIKKALLKQLVVPVRWEQCMHKIYARKEGTNFPRTMDIGSQGRMKLLLKAVNSKAADACICA